MFCEDRMPWSEKMGRNRPGKTTLPSSRKRKQEDNMPTPWGNGAAKNCRNTQLPNWHTGIKWWPWTPWLWTWRTSFGVTQMEVLIELCCFLVSYVLLNKLLSFCNPLCSQLKLTPQWGTGPALKERNLLREKTWEQILTRKEWNCVSATDTALLKGRLCGFVGSWRMGAWRAKNREIFPRKVIGDPVLDWVMRRSWAGDWGQKERYNWQEQHVRRHRVLQLPSRSRSRRTVGEWEHERWRCRAVQRPHHTGPSNQTKNLEFFPMADRQTSKNISLPQVYLGC